MEQMRQPRKYLNAGRRELDSHGERQQEADDAADRPHDNVKRANVLVVGRKQKSTQPSR